MARIVAVWIEQSDSSQAEPFLVEQALKKIRVSYNNVPVYSNRLLAGATCLAGTNSLPDLLAQMFAANPGHEQDSVVLFYDFYPLFDADLSIGLEKDHFKYLAHFTFSENVPVGFAPDFVSRELAEILNGRGVNDLRAFMVKNMNEFDVELFYKSPDLRHYRLNLSTASSRSRWMLKSIMANAPDLTYAGLEGYITAHPEILCPQPSYLELEITNRKPFSSSALYPPDPRAAIDLEEAKVNLLIEEVNGLALDSYAIALGGQGEPLLHPGFHSILQKGLINEKTSRLYLETWGHDLEQISVLKALPQANKLSIIVRLPAIEARLYQTLTGMPFPVKVLAWLKQYADSRRDYSVYVEMPKIKATEEHIDEYFAFFKELAIPCILTKFNRYVDLLADLRLVDMSPQHRMFCWHLARDLYVTCEGLISFCKQDPWARRVPATVYHSGNLKEIWKKQQANHALSAQGKHAELQMPCMNCDEWYTFNA